MLDVFIQFIVSFYAEGPLKISHKGEGPPSLIVNKLKLKLNGDEEIWIIL